MKTPLNQLQAATRKLTRQHIDFEEIEARATYPIRPVADIYRLIDDMPNAGIIGEKVAATLRAIFSMSKSGLCYASNATLKKTSSVKSEITISKHIKILRDLGLITAHDSANCKRSRNFGFSTLLLHARYEELAAVIRAAASEEEQRSFFEVKYRNAKRRVKALLEDGVFADQRDFLLAQYEAAQDLIEAAKRATADHFTEAFNILAATIRTANKRLNIVNKLSGDSPNDMRIHITTANLSVKCSELQSSASAERIISNVAADGGESDMEKEDFRGNLNTHEEQSGTGKPERRGNDQITLGMVMQACPAIKDWATGAITGWVDLDRATDQIAMALGVNKSAVLEGRTVMGTQLFAASIAVLLQKYDRDSTSINSPGGYVRGMIASARAGKLRLDRSIYGLLAEQKKLDHHGIMV